MRKLLLVLGLLGLWIVPEQHASAYYNCSAWYGQYPGGYGKAKCLNGGGTYRVKVYCYNGVDYTIEYGDYVSVPNTSTEWCNNNRTPVGAFVSS